MPADTARRRRVRRRFLAGGIVVSLALAACASESPGGDGTPTDTSSATAAVIHPAGVDDPGWRVSNAQFRGRSGIEGYADHVSVLPGESVRLFVSSPTSHYRVAAYRMTGSAKSGALRVWRSGNLTGGRQTHSVHDDATRSTAAGWKASFSVSTAGWSEGAYLFRLTATNGSASFVPLTVRSASTAGKVVIANGVITWQAYNTWGGKSAYTDADEPGFSRRAYAASFDRPYANGLGAGKFLGYENPVILRAERLGIPLAYETTIDIATRPGLLKGALGYVSLGHDEYWTRSERDSVESARNHGTNLGFLGANVSYWQVRLSNSMTGTGANRTVIIYKSRSADPVKGNGATVNFRDVGRPENQMTGQLYECYPAKGKYTVLDPHFFLFNGTGAVMGSQYSDIVKVEVDRAYPIAGTPRPLQVVAKSATDCGGSSTWSTSSYYSVPSGAGVFATGTMGWVLWGMSSQSPPQSRRFVNIVTDNLLREMAAGPMGTRHPATDNLTTLGLGTSNTTGSA